MSRDPEALGWRATFTNDEVNALHSEAFGTRPYSAAEWDWEGLSARWSLGWVVARRDGALCGFANVIWDGLTHAWLQDVMVAAADRGHGLGRRIVEVAAAGARDAGCEWLHVDFAPELAPFYLQACGFAPAPAGLLSLHRGDESREDELPVEGRP